MLHAYTLFSTVCPVINTSINNKALFSSACLKTDIHYCDEVMKNIYNQGDFERALELSFEMWGVFCIYLKVSNLLFLFTSRTTYSYKNRHRGQEIQNITC